MSIGSPIGKRTVVQTRSGMVHFSTGMNAYLGTQTACGRFVNEVGHSYVSADRVADEVSCSGCKRAIQKAQSS